MYTAAKERYTQMEYKRCGDSGLMLPKVSLGLWHNFGDTANFENMKKLCFTAFDNGITQFDLANNYGPEPGSAEKNFGRILKEDLGVYRDELIITTKAGYDMWEGPYGNWGSRKYLLASLDWNTSIFFIITEWIRKLLLKRQWEHWQARCRVEKQSMSVFPTMTALHWKKQLQSSKSCIVRL